MQQLAVQTLPVLDQGLGPYSRQQGQRTEAVFAKRGETELKATCISTAEHVVPSQKPIICWGSGGGRGNRLDCGRKSVGSKPKKWVCCPVPTSWPATA